MTAQEMIEKASSSSRTSLTTREAFLIKVDEIAVAVGPD